MFEKSLYDLIRGLRNHRGSERSYIQDSLRECRTEIKSQDMDVKATALLKLVYLEMYGHDMSWASFHILEVMSSVKYLHKRAGYLAAVQSFRSDTEVLMLATNLLKKDLSAPVPAVLSLPLVTLPHLITSSLAMSLQTDVLPRLTHSQAAIRKKTVVALYRFALVYPETLRAAWPRIKERLMDESEDPSVTAAIVNVVCELGWRRPQDFLPLAPRLFSLLVESGNNWMAIKIIKLFATLTPLEPRLVRKLLPPLTSLIRTTPAMSLLYECINGIIQGGILENTEDTTEGEEIARLCLGKLRGMIALEGDPNLKYVALLAFQKIVKPHPYLVSLHQDVILGCLDDPDISIRLRALDLLVDMVDSENLVAVVSKLMRQLYNSPVASNVDDAGQGRSSAAVIVPAADSDDEDPEESLRPAERRPENPPPLPEEYRTAVAKRILEMCSRDTYANISDFVWYTDVLVELVPLAPVAATPVSSAEATSSPDAYAAGTEEGLDVTRDIGLEMLNVAVRVKDVRLEATRAAEKLILGAWATAPGLSPMAGRAFLTPAAWIVGEYAAYLSYPQDTLAALLHPSSATLPAGTLIIYLQAIPKLFVVATDVGRTGWSLESKSMVSLRVASIVHFLEPLTTHPELEVQERSVEFVELMRLVADAVSAQPAVAEDGTTADPPIVMTQVVPSLFTGLELNPVAPAAQKKVPLPHNLNLDTRINDSLPSLLQSAVMKPAGDDEGDFAETSAFYHQRPQPARATVVEPAANILDRASAEATSYQSLAAAADEAPEVAERRRAERRARNKDDPFYIPTAAADSGAASPIHSIIQNSNGVDVDIDSIPIMDLNIDSRERGSGTDTPRRAAEPRSRRRVDVTGDETLPFDHDDSNDAGQARTGNRATRSASRDSSQHRRPPRSKAKKSLLQVDSSGLGEISLDSPDAVRYGGASSSGTAPDAQDQGGEDDEEMLRALREIEKRRLEIQRETERIQLAQGVSAEGTLIKKKFKAGTKKKKRKSVAVAVAVEAVEAEEDGKWDSVTTKRERKEKKKKKKKKAKDGEGEVEAEKKAREEAKDDVHDVGSHQEDLLRGFADEGGH